MKLGRKPVVHTPESLRKALALAYHLDALGAPPAVSNDYVSAVGSRTYSWGMDGNDTIGDCTCADAAHQHMLWTANTGQIEVPTTEETIALYSAITGYNPADPSTDQGAEIAAVCAYIEKNGAFGNKLQGYADVHPKNLDHVRWGIQLFGTVKLGINLPKSAMDQFTAGNGWTYNGDTNILGGHDVCAVGYHKAVWYVVTWGRLITMGPAFFNQYVEEVKVPLALNWCRAGNVAPSKLNLTQLEADLALEGAVS